jgi:hypothetical protein
MKTISFRGKDEVDIERQLWDWRTTNSKAVISIKHPIERLPLVMRPTTMGAKMQALDLVLMRIDYTDTD